MVPSQEQPAAERGTSEAPPSGPSLAGDAVPPGQGPSDDPEAALEKVEVELEGPEPREPPEGGWGWLVMLASMWCNGSVFGIQNACGVLFVSMLETFGSKDDDNMVFKTGEARAHPEPEGRAVGLSARARRAALRGVRTRSQNLLARGFLLSSQ